MMSLGIYGTFLAGFSSNNKFAFLGGLRASSQMISYEITMGATLVGLLMIFGTLDLAELNRAQGELLWGWLPKWGIFLQPLGFLLFLTAGMAETKRIPFDLPEGESEIIGYFLEYSSMKFGAFFMTDFVETILIAALIATLFFGGWQVPYLQSDGFHFPWGSVPGACPHLLVTLLQIAAFAFKVVLLLLVPAPDPLDAAAFPLRSAHAARLEDPAAPVRPEHLRHRLVLLFSAGPNFRSMRMPAGNSPTADGAQKASGSIHLINHERHEERTGRDMHWSWNIVTLMIGAIGLLQASPIGEQCFALCRFGGESREPGISRSLLTRFRISWLYSLQPRH